MELSEQEMRTFDLGQDRDIISIDMQLTMEIVTPLLYILHLLKCFSIALLFFYCSSLVSSAFALKFVTIFLPMALDWQQFSGHQCKVNIKNQTKVNGRNRKSDGLECSVSRPHCGKC